MPVISVGNISLGGTGKSLLVAFLVHRFEMTCAGILLRGHKRAGEKGSFIVSLGDNRAVDVSEVGDEAAMHAFLLSVPVVVGASRIKSSELLAAQMTFKKKSYFLLDDGYQQFGIKIDCSILVVDGRSLWGNGWTLPAGLLREYDITRADIIVVSHSKHLSTQERIFVQHELIHKAKKELPCFFGYHAIDGYFEWTSGGMIKRHEPLLHEPVAVFAGIGSFEQFVFSVKEMGGKVEWQQEFPDHYQYSLEDLVEIMHAVEKFSLLTICTTVKDWVKIYPLLLHVKSKKRWIILDCSFSFITTQQEIQFLEAVKKCIERKR